MRKDRKETGTAKPKDNYVQLQSHNSHFTDPSFELSRTEYEIGQYSTIQCSKSIAQYNLGLVQQLCTIYNMSFTNRCV